MTAARLKTIACLAIPVIAAGEFVVDLLTPSGITDWVWYVIPLLFTLYVGGRFLPYALAAVLSILLMAGLFFPPAGINPEWALTSRLAGILVLWVMALMISHRKQTDAEAHKLSRAVEHSPVSIVITDKAGNIEYVNPKFTKVTGYSLKELTGKNSHLLKSDEMPPENYQRLWKTIAAGGEWRGEFHNRKKNGELFWESASISPIADDAGNITHFLAVKEDITEKKKLEARFLRAQRMESIGTLASGIAHDLNNVLTPLLISVQVLKEKATDEDGRKLLELLEVNVQRGASLVKQVLAFGRGIEGERVLVYPAHVVREIKQIVHETFPKAVEFEFHPPADLWAIIGDPTQLHQVLLNLCVNARDAMPNGGKLSIHVENVTFDETYAGMELEARPGPYVAISVADTGTGIPKEIRDKIFDPFFSTKAPGKGTGLGLSTTLAIVKSHGGFIHCHSEPGRGATFKVYFPANNLPVAAEKLSVDEFKLPHGHNELVLVVDDEEPIRKLVQKALERFGYRVLLASDGAEAVSLYRSRQKEIDVVITDIVMPIMDGTTTIAVLKNINPDVRIVTSSGLASDGGIAKARNSGVKHFIPKPYTAETMLNTLHDALHGNPAN